MEAKKTSLNEVFLSNRVLKVYHISDSYTDEDRQRLVKTIGNFILLRDKLKAADKKGDWTKKKAAMSTKVEGIETSFVAARALKTWNEKTIEQRNKKFADQVINAWRI